MDLKRNILHLYLSHILFYLYVRPNIYLTDGKHSEIRVKSKAEKLYCKCKQSQQNACLVPEVLRLLIFFCSLFNAKMLEK